MQFFVKWFSTNAATSRAGSIGRVPEFDGRTVGEMSVCINRKFLRPANSNKNFRDFPRTYSKTSTGIQAPFCTVCFLNSGRNFRFFVKMRPSQRTQISTHFSSALSKFSRNSPTSFRCIIPTFHFPPHNLLCFSTFHLVFSLILPEGRTGMLLLGNFRSNKFSVFSVPIINIAPLTTCPCYFVSPSLAVS
jgi:hypothetical protein